MTAALEISNLKKAFGGLPATQDVSLDRAAGRAAADHRAQRRRQDHALQPDHRRSAARLPARSALFGEDVSAWRRTSARTSASRAPTRSSRCSRRTRWSTTSRCRCSGVTRRALERVRRSLLAEHLYERGARACSERVGLEQLARSAARRGRLWREAPRRDRDGAGAEAARAAAGRAARGPVARGARHRASELIAAIPRDTTVVMIEHDMDTALDLAEQHHRAALRQRDRRRHRADVVVAIRRRARSILATEALALEGVDALYGDSHVLHGVSFALAAGPRAGAARTQRRGQDHLHEHDHRLRCRRAGARCACSASRSSACRPRRSRARASASCRRAGACFRRYGAGEPARGAPDARHGGKPWTLRARVRPFPRLNERAEQHAGSLSGGEQQMLAIGRALMGNPRVLLMDEPPKVSRR